MAENKPDAYQQAHNEGVLYILATPIGNLGDISERAIGILTCCDFLAVEDSRHSSKLLNHLGINKKMVVYHDHNERQKAQYLLDLCLDGGKIVLVSDAGTPLISDPGYFLVKQALEQGVKVVPIPGACAAITALSAAGLASDRFAFEGFLPAKSSARETKLLSLKNEPRTLIFYESTHRIIACLQSMAKCFGDSRIATLAKELTKSHESIVQGTFVEILNWIEIVVEHKKGEFVILVAGSEEESEFNFLPDDETLMKRLLVDLSVKRAAQLAADLTGKRKKLFYNLGIKLS